VPDARDRKLKRMMVAVQDSDPLRYLMELKAPIDASKDDFFRIYEWAEEPVSLTPSDETKRQASSKIGLGSLCVPRVEV